MGAASHDDDVRRFECRAGSLLSGARYVEIRGGVSAFVFRDGRREPCNVTLAKAESLVRRNVFAEIVPPSRPRRQRGKVVPK